MEGYAEGRKRTESRAEAGLGYRKSAEKKRACISHTQAGKRLGIPLSHHTAEQLTEICGMIPCLSGQHLQCQSFLKVQLKIGIGALDPILIPYRGGTLDGLLVLAKKKALRLFLRMKK